MTAACAASCLIAGAAGQVGADEGAGTRSIFASGAGTRPLGMGGAFSAIADDASALWWNPAGLGLATRSGFEAAHASSGPGFTETWAALVVPSWRWGAAGLSIHHFGASDIERRDERNVLVASDLTDAETELALGYARRLGTAWSAGGAIKMQHQSLAGLSAVGLGVDLGVQLRPLLLAGSSHPWASQLRVGVAARNAVEPSQRLDRETVVDPMVLRTGLGWENPMGAWGGLLASLEVESGRRAEMRTRMGLEMRLPGQSAVRFGWNGDGLTAGTGIAWRDLGVEYAYESTTLESVHRVGLSLSFGMTVDQARRAAQRREDEALEKRLAQAFGARQAEQAEALVARARSARAAGRCDDALEALAGLLALEPDHREARALQAGCFADRARALEEARDFSAAALAWDEALRSLPSDSAAAQGGRRCRAESDRLARRSADHRAGFAAALDAFAAGHLLEAREGFSALLAQKPGDTDAHRMLVRTQQAVAARASGLVGQARVLTRANLLDEAQTALEEARALAPDVAGLSAAAAELVRSRQGARAAASATPEPGRSHVEPGPPPAPRVSDAELESLYRRGVAAFQARRIDDAVRYWELVWSARPGYREVRELLKREYLARGLEAFASGRLEEAAGHWEAVLRVDPTDARAGGYLSRAREALARQREILGARP